MSDTEKCPWCKCALVDDECPTEDCRDCISYFNNMLGNEQLWVDRRVREAVDAERVGYQVIADTMQSRLDKCCGARDEHCDVCLELDCWIGIIRDRKDGSTQEAAP